MRKYLIPAALVLALPLIFIWGPQAFEGTDQIGAQSEDQSQIEANRMAEAQRLKDSLRKKIGTNEKQATHFDKEPAARPAKKVAVRRKARKSQGRVLPKAPKFKTAKVDDAEESVEAIKKRERVNRNFSNPMEERWIDELSGQRVQFDMGKTKVESTCSSVADNCENRRKDNEVSIVGVVVNTDRMMKNPLKSLDGKVKNGRYDDYTPAVYLK